MRRLHGLVACGLLLAGCGESRDHGPASEAGAVQLVSQTSGGGRSEARATPLTDEAAVDRYLAGLDGALAAKLRAAITRSGGPGRELYAQVVAVGCDVPRGASASVGRTVVVRAEPIASPRPECFAPVTTVALVRVD